jgi:predicted acylesterase/phospholipase RssA
MGGGAAGVSQAGMLLGMKDAFNKGCIKAVSGASVGALNAALVASYDFDKLESVWASIRRKDVYSYWGLLDFFSGGWFSTIPLLRLIEKNVDLDKVYESDIRLFVQACDRDTAMPVIATNESKDLLEILYASASIPVAFPQVYSTHRKVWMVDGGVVDNSPLSWLSGYYDDTISVSCEYVIVLHCQPSTPFSRVNKSLSRLNMLSHTVRLLYRANQRIDELAIEMQNRMVRKGLIKHHEIKLIHLYPPKDVNVSTLDFDRRKLDDALNKGIGMGMKLCDFILDGNLEDWQNQYTREIGV